MTEPTPSVPDPAPTDDQRLAIASTWGLPADFLPVLTGTTPDEVDARASELAASMPEYDVAQAQAARRLAAANPAEFNRRLEAGRIRPEILGHRREPTPVEAARTAELRHLAKTDPVEFGRRLDAGEITLTPGR